MFGQIWKRKFSTPRVHAKKEPGLYHWTLPIVATDFSTNSFNEYPDCCVINSWIQLSLQCGATSSIIYKYCVQSSAMKINLLNNLGEQLLSFCIFTSGGLWKFPGGGFSGFWIFSYSGHLLVERKKIIDLTFFQKGGTFLQISIQGWRRPLSFPGGGTSPWFSRGEIPYSLPHEPPLNYSRTINAHREPTSI